MSYLRLGIEGVPGVDGVGECCRIMDDKLCRCSCCIVERSGRNGIPANKLKSGGSDGVIGMSFACS